MSYLGENIPKLGFGLMRLPKTADGKEDIEQVKVMVDHFLQAGFTYFDTAYVYDDGASEAAIKEALVDRYPRESYQLATKLCAWMQCTDEESAKQEFYTSLERTGAGYFDFYLLHALQDGNFKVYDDYHMWDFVRELKAKGLVKNWGFSCHASPENFEKILKEHSDADFVQLQLNYADWENPSVASRACYEIARKYNKPIVIMEPVKGGALANPPKTVQKVFDAADPNASYASWAIRYAASLEGIITVLSGMSNIEQMDNNISYMKDFKPLDASEQQVVAKAVEALNSSDSIPCTGCHYCTGGCPMQIPIPEIFAAKNTVLIWENEERGKGEYARATNGKAKASDCIECGQCVSACPQQINVIEQLKKCSATFD